MKAINVTNNRLGDLKHRMRAEYTPGVVSIVISARNGLKYTIECIDSINRHTPEKFEYVLVDNGSKDGTAEYFKSIPNATVIMNKAFKGRAEAFNQSLLAARGEYIVLLSNDTVVTKEWLSRMMMWLQKDPTIGIVGVRTNSASNHKTLQQASYNPMEEMNRFAEQWSQKHSRQGYKADLLSDVCMMFHRNLAAKIGGFDQRFNPYYGDDHDFCIRTMISGKKLWVANDVFIHQHELTLTEMYHEDFNKIRVENLSKLYEKWEISKWEIFAGVAQREKPFNPNRHYVPLKPY